MHASFLFLKYLALILVGGKIASEIFYRLKLSPVIGEIFVGFVLGAHCLGFINLLPDTHEVVIVTALSELGVIFMLFYLGLEVNLKQIKEVGVTALMVALGGVLLPFTMGYLVGYWMFPEIGWAAHLFIGAIMTATSVAITARIMEDYGLNNSQATRIILAAAVIDDIMGLFILSVVLAIGGMDQATHGETANGLSHLFENLFGFHHGLLLSISLIAFFLLIILPLFARFSPPFLRLINRMEGKGALMVVALALMLFLSWLSAECGLAPIVGAFFFGVIVSSSNCVHALEEKVEPICLFLAPIFFVFIGLNIDPVVMLSSWKFALVITSLAVVSKFFGAAIMARFNKSSKTEASLIGLGMVPRGEVGLIIANIGLAGGIISKEIFSGVAAMCILTILVVPGFIKKLALKYKQEEGLSAK
jgi:Kef-type K+ transport system membrane component KefB